MVNKPIVACPFHKLHPSQLQRDDLFYMQLAYNAALEAWQKGEVPIGAVAVWNGEIVAHTHNQVETLKDPTAHAEILAITQAAHKVGDWRLNGVKLYVTKEPCPMCAGACVFARLAEVHYAVEDPKFGALGGAYDTSKLASLNHTVRVLKGTFEAECRQLLQMFFQLRRQEETPAV